MSILWQKFCRRELAFDYVLSERPTDTPRTSLFFQVVSNSFPSEFGNMSLRNRTFLGQYSRLLSKTNPEIFQQEYKFSWEFLLSFCLMPGSFFRLLTFPIPMQYRYIQIFVSKKYFTVHPLQTKQFFKWNLPNSILAYHSLWSSTSVSNNDFSCETWFICDCMKVGNLLFVLFIFLLVNSIPDILFKIVQNFSEHSLCVFFF